MKKSKKKKLNTKKVSKKRIKNDEVKDVLSFILILAITFIVSIAMHMLSLHTSLFKNMDVLFYRGIVLLILTTIVLFFILYLLSKNVLKISIKEIICIVLVCFSINLTIFTLVPVTIDRSVTVFTLGQFNKASNNELTKNEMEKIFIDDYVYEKGAFDKRFHEQVTTGSIEESKDEKYVLTNRGKTLISLFKAFAKLYNVNLSNLSE